MGVSCVVTTGKIVRLLERLHDMLQPALCPVQDCFGYKELQFILSPKTCISGSWEVSSGVAGN